MDPGRSQVTPNRNTFICKLQAIGPTGAARRVEVLLLSSLVASVGRVIQSCKGVRPSRLRTRAGGDQAGVRRGTQGGGEVGGEVGDVVPVEHAADDVAKRAEGLRRVAGAHVRGILAQGHVARPLPPVLEGPVLAQQCQRAARRHLGGQAAQEGAPLLAGRTLRRGRPADRWPDLQHRPGPLPPSRPQGAGERGARPQPPLLHRPPWRPPCASTVGVWRNASPGGGSQKSRLTSSRRPGWLALTAKRYSPPAAWIRRHRASWQSRASPLPTRPRNSGRTRATRRGATAAPRGTPPPVFRRLFSAAC